MIHQPFLTISEQFSPFLVQEMLHRAGPKLSLGAQPGLAHAGRASPSPSRFCPKTREGSSLHIF